MGGFNAELFRPSGMTGFGTDLISSNVPSLGLTQDNQKANAWARERAIAGFFGRVNYNYKERYMLEANLRYDGSSRFVGDKRWGCFLHSPLDGISHAKISSARWPVLSAR